MLILTPQNGSGCCRWRKSATVFQSQFYPSKLTILWMFLQGRIKCRLYLTKSRPKRQFLPQKSLWVECSDPARNPYFPADFLSARFRCSRLLRNCVKITAVYQRARGERWPEKNTDDLSQLWRDSQPWQNRI